ncbi:trafficking protein particle complex 6B [Cricetulus griseus]
MADEALFLLLHNEMVSGVYKSAEQGEVVSAATHRGVLRDACFRSSSAPRPQTPLRLDPTGPPRGARPTASNLCVGCLLPFCFVPSVGWAGVRMCLCVHATDVVFTIGPMRVY